MASILRFRRTAPAAAPENGFAAFLEGASLEVMPRTAAGVEDFLAILPPDTRVYIAHVDGTPFSDMLATARRLVEEAMVPMPHFAARGIASAAEFEARVKAYADAGVREALVVAGGLSEQRGPFASSMALLETHAFDRAGFTRLHVAGHPEGSPDIPAPAAADALAWKNVFQTRTDASMALVTQFAFDAKPIIAWADRLRTEGVTLPIHVGVAGPARLQTLIKYAMLCGVGPSMRVLQRRAADLTRLMLPFEPTDVLVELARHKAAHPDCLIAGAHFFTLGGLSRTASYLAGSRRGPVRARA